MKSLKAIITVFVAVATMSTMAYAQVSAPQDATQTKSSTKQAKASGSKTEKSGEAKDHDMESTMAKLGQEKTKLQSKMASETDPQKKADYQTAISKISEVENDYSAYTKTAGASKEQQEAAHKKLQSDMKELKEMQKSMKAKYGEGGGQGQSKDASKQGKKSQATHQAPATQDAVPATPK